MNPPKPPKPARTRFALRSLLRGRRQMVQMAAATVGNRDLASATGLGSKRTPKLGLLVPSRGRPENIKRLIAALKVTTDPQLTYLHVGIDDDDPRRPEYESDWFNFAGTFDYGLHSRSGLRQVVAWCNCLASLTVDRYWSLGHLNDDNLPETPGWDRRVLASLERQQTGFCFADDQHPGRPAGALACHIFMTSDIVRALGYMAYPGLRHLYVDDIWTLWGQSSSIEFLDDVAITHLHPTARADVEVDETYRAAAACDLEDRAVFMEYQKLHLQCDLDKINSLRVRRSRSSAPAHT